MAFVFKAICISLSGIKSFMDFHMSISSNGCNLCYYFYYVLVLIPNKNMLWYFCIIIIHRFIDQWNMKGTNVRQKTYEIFHVYSIFYSGFMCQTTVIFGITKDGSRIKYFSIMKLFHLQKPLSKWR